MTKRTFPKVLSLVIVLMMILSNFLIVPVSAQSAEVAESASLSQLPSQPEGTYRYYFYMPPQWLNESTATTGNTAGIYWWEDSAVPEGWPGYAANKADVEGVFYYDVPTDVKLVVWNNFFDGGTVASAPYFADSVQTYTIGTEYYDPYESDLYPEGTENFDGMIFVTDFTDYFYNDKSGKVEFGGEWFYYYGNGEYGTSPKRGGSEILTGYALNSDESVRGWDDVNTTYPDSEKPPVTEAPTPDEVLTGVMAGDTFYDAQVGDIVTYTAYLQADELFEDFQAVVSYDSAKLQLVRKGEDEDEIACPNLDNLIFYAEDEGLVKFNATKLKGMNFKEEKVLITLDFVVLDNTRSSVDLLIEFMTVKGNEEDYFFKGQPVKTDGISVSEAVEESVLSTTAPVTEAPTEVPTAAPSTVTPIPTPDEVLTGVVAGDTFYDAQVGDIVTYTAYLQADELFEDFQAVVSYDSAKLQLVRKGEDEDEIACPNLDNLVFYAEDEGLVKFNATKLKGMNFKEEKVLITLDFVVLDNTRSSVDLLVEFMTVLGNEEDYFFKGQPVKTDGISIVESVAEYVPDTTEPVTEIPTTEPMTDISTVVTTAPPVIVPDETGIVVDDVVYDVQAGDTVTYTAYLQADELFEDFQAVVSYDSAKLQLVRKGEDEDEIACPNLDNLVFYAEEDGVIRFNATKLKGMNFKSEKVLITLDFVVLDNTRSSIDLLVEFMTVLGNEEDYFFKGEQIKTEGISFTEILEDTVPATTAPVTEIPTTEPIIEIPTVVTTAPPVIIPGDTGIVVDDVVYDVQAGDTVTYVAYLKADQLFEDIQAVVSYDSAKLQLVRKGEYEDEIACPNLSALVFNADVDGIVSFNSTKYKGMNFKSEKVLITLEFVVLDNTRSSIDLLIEFMTIKGGEENYFFKGEPGKTEGITIREVLSTPINTPPVEGVLDNGLVYYEENRGELSITGFEGKYIHPVIIPDTIEGLPVAKINSGVFDSSDMFRVYIPETVMVIEDNAFDVQDIHIVYGGTSAQWKSISIGNGNEEIYLGTRHYSGKTDAYTLSTVEPDCMHEGYVLHSCIYCDDTYKTDFTEIVDHFVQDGKCIYCKESFNIIESYHTYAGDTDDAWVVRKDGAKTVVLTFSENTMVEKNYDWIYIYDKNDNQVGRYTGDELAGATIEVSGDVAKVRLVSDDMNEFYGFRAEYDFVMPVKIAILGDVTGDDKVNVRDATHIQKALAQLVELTEVQRIAADVDGNGVMNIRDATAIQKWLAQIEVPYDIGSDILR